jgi:hypothetical protein
MKALLYGLGAAALLAPTSSLAATLVAADLADGTETVAGVTVTAQAGTFSEDGFDPVTETGTGTITLAGSLVADEGGLGVRNAVEGIPLPPFLGGFLPLDDEDVDGFGARDVIVFSFDELVTLTSAGFASFDGLLTNEFVLFAGDDLASLTAFTELTVSEMVALGVTGRAFGFGARSFEDDFVLTSLGFEPVPLPGAALFLLTGLGAAGLARRR